MARQFTALLIGMLSTIWLAGCGPANPPKAGVQTTFPKIPDGKSRIYVLREHSIFQAPVDARFKLNGVTVARLSNRDFTYLDGPALLLRSRRPAEQRSLALGPGAAGRRATF